MGKKRPDSDYLEVFNQCRSGVTRYELAKRLGVSISRIGEMLKQAERIEKTKAKASINPFCLLSVRSQNALNYCGLHTIEDVRKALEGGRLFDIPNLGKVSQLEIAKWLSMESKNDSGEGDQQTLNMKRTNFYYPQPMLDALKNRSDETGISVSELIRTAIAEFLSKK